MEGLDKFLEDAWSQMKGMEGPFWEMVRGRLEDGWRAGGLYTDLLQEMK